MAYICQNCGRVHRTCQFCGQEVTCKNSNHRMAISIENWINFVLENKIPVSKQLELLKEFLKDNGFDTNVPIIAFPVL